MIKITIIYKTENVNSFMYNTSKWVGQCSVSLAKMISDIFLFIASQQ